MRSEGYCSWVCLCVCLSVKSHLTSRMSNRAINQHTYLVAYERQKICGDFPETTAFKSYAAKHERKSQYANFPAYPWSGFSPLDARRSARGYHMIVNNIQPCPKRCLLMPLVRVGVRTDNTTRYSYNAGRGQLPRTRIGIMCSMRRGFALYHFDMNL